MTGIILSLIFAGLAASMAWQSGKRGLGYLKTGREFMEVASTQATGRNFLLAGALWTGGAIIMIIVAVALLGLAVYYVTML